jgi:hypothetical protein
MHGNPRQTKNHEKKPRVNTLEHTDEEVEEEAIISPFPLIQATPREDATEILAPPDQSPHTPEHTSQTLDTPTSEHSDPTYVPSETPRSRREVQPTKTEPPITRSRARVVSQEYLTNVN